MFAEEVADLISDITEFELAGFIEGFDPEKCEKTLLGLPVIWIDDVPQLDDSFRAVCAVGTTKRKNFIKQARSHGLKFASIIHPSVQISSTALLGEGNLLSMGTIIAAMTRIGKHVIVNRGALIGHHTEIGDFVTISPGVNIAGRVSIGECSYMGMGAIILDGISIGSNTVVGAGALVTRDIPDFVQVMGMPARVVKELK